MKFKFVLVAALASVLYDGCHGNDSTEGSSGGFDKKSLLRSSKVVAETMVGREADPVSQGDDESKEQGLVPGSAGMEGTGGNRSKRVDSGTMDYPMEEAVNEESPGGSDGFQNDLAGKAPQDRTSSGGLDGDGVVGSGTMDYLMEEVINKESTAGSAGVQDGLAGKATQDTSSSGRLDSDGVVNIGGLGGGFAVESEESDLSPWGDGAVPGLSILPFTIDDAGVILGGPELNDNSGDPEVWMNVEDQHTFADNTMEPDLALDSITQSENPRLSQALDRKQLSLNVDLFAKSAKSDPKFLLQHDNSNTLFQV